MSGRGQGKRGARLAALAAACALALAAGRAGAQTTDPEAQPQPAPSALPPAPAQSAAAAEEPAAPPRAVFHYTLESIEVSGNVRTNRRVVLRYVPFRPGQLLDVDDPEIEFLRFRLLGTGFFQSVSLSLRRGSERGKVVLVIHVVERNTIVVNDVWMGLSATADANGNARPLSAYGGADLAETNLVGTGITLGGAFALAENQLALRLRFLDPAFLGTAWLAQTTLYYNDAREFYGTRGVLYDDPFSNPTRVEDFAVARYKRFGGTVGAGRDLSVTTQLFFDYRLEGIDALLPLAASQVRGPDIEPIQYNLLPGKSVLSTLGASIAYDTRDSPVLPTRGFQVQVAGSVSLAPFGSNYAFEKLQVRASRWWLLPWQHVFRLEAFAGAVGGEAPVFEKFYVADFSDLLPDRVLELNTDRRPAPNFFHTDIAEVRFGDYAAKLQGEYRIPLYRGSRSVYGVDLFLASGLYGVATRREFTDPARGYSGFGRVPVDFTFNLGLRMDTKAGGFTFAFANVLGFLPALRAALTVRPRGRRLPGLVLLAALAAPALALADDPPPIVAKSAVYTWDRNLLLMTLGYRDVVDEEISQKLSSGIPTVILMHAYVYEKDGTTPVALSGKTCRVVFDPWDEVYRVELVLPGLTRPRNDVASNLLGVLRKCADADRLPMVERAKLKVKGTYYVQGIVEVNPISPEIMERIKRWVSRPLGSTTIGAGDALFGSFVGLFVARIGAADRVVAYRTQSFIVPPPPPPPSASSGAPPPPPPPAPPPPAPPPPPPKR